MNISPRNIQLGAKYRDLITGFTGTATGYVEYISGCNQAMLAPTLGDDGKPRDAAWFDVQRLERLPDPAIVLDNVATPGFDMAPPLR